MLWGRDWLQLNEKKSMESDELILKRMESNELMSWYWKRKPTWRRDLITYNSRPRILFHFNWLVIIWKGGIYLKLDVQSQGSGRILYVTGQSGWGVLKIGQFSWTSYVYRRYIYTHDLTAQSVRVSERNSVVVASNPTQVNFL